MAGKYTKKVPEFVWFIGSLEPGKWKQGPYVNRPKGYKDGDKSLLKFKLELIEEKKE